MTKNYDIVVLGLGAMGSAAVDAFSRAGYKVCGIEQYVAVHDKGSSFGETRAIRKAYFEDPAYVPFVLDAYEGWKDLQSEMGQSLLHEVGCLIMGPEHSPVIQGCEKSARQENLNYEIFDSSFLKSQYGLEIPSHQWGFYEPQGGYLKVEPCLRAFHSRAKRNGAELVFQTPIQEISLSGGAVQVQTHLGSVHAERAFVALGPWTAGSTLFSSLPLSLQLSVKRAVQYWFSSQGQSHLPVFFQDTEKGPWVYGFPEIEGRMKCAFHNVFEECQPKTLNRQVCDQDIELIEPHMKSLFGNWGSFLEGKVCMYSMTPDEHFYLGGLVSHPQLFIAGGFSGHGFKFAPAVGNLAVRYFSSQGTSKEDQQVFKNSLSSLFSLQRLFDA